MTRAPTISTKRLVLRHHIPDDVEVMAPYFASDWAQYMDGPISRDELWRWIAAETISWDWLGYGSWAVTLNDQLIGQVGINQPPRFPEIELGWCIFPEYQKTGVAFEAAKAALNWGFGERKINTLVSYVSSENVASIALAEKLGASLDNDAARPDAHDLVYRHSREGAS